jgi:hypothetical protein
LTVIVGVSKGVNTIDVYADDFAGNMSPPTSLQVTYRPLDPPNDFFANAIILTNTAGTNSVNTLNATKEIGEPNHAGNVGGKSAWWSFTPPVDGVLTVSTTNSTFDTVMALYTGTIVTNLNPIASNDDAFAGDPGGFSQIVQAVRANETYHIAVDGYDGLAGVVFLTYSFSPATVFQVSAGAAVGGTVSPSSALVESNGVIVLSAIPNEDYQFDIWNGDVVSLVNPLSIVVNGNVSVTAGFRPVASTDGFESGNLQHIGWTTDGNKPWMVQTNHVSGGACAARSGVITNNQTSSLILTANFRAGSGSFDYLVGSEPVFDTLRFYLDGTLIEQWSGNQGWARFSFPITAGPHTLEWQYAKDAFNSAGLDAAFIDRVDLPLIPETNRASSAYLRLGRQSDGNHFIELLGQTNQQYVIQSSSNLVDWQNLATNVNVAGFLRVLDPDSAMAPIRFYRALVP